MSLDGTKGFKRMYLLVPRFFPGFRRKDDRESTFNLY